jgi:UDP-glucose 4-epimerase
MNLPDVERILITGGAGFIGRRVANVLRGQGKLVAMVDNQASGLPMPAAARGLKPYLMDIRDEESLARAFEEFRPEAVIHLAAVHHIPTVERRRAYAQDVDILGTERVLNECEKHKVGIVVAASSAAVYAPVEGTLVEDETPLQAIDNYSLCKLVNEQQVRFWTERTGAPARLIRFFNTVGPDDPTGHLLPDVLNQLHGQKETATVRLGNTSPRRDYVHGDDSAEACAALVTKGEVKAMVEAFNVCRGLEFSVTDLVEQIGDFLGLKIVIETDLSRVRPVDRQSICGSNTKLVERTGWMWRYDFPQIVRKTIEGMGFELKS